MDIIKLYKEGRTTTEVGDIVGLHNSTIWYRLKKAGVLRTKAESVAIAGKKGRLGSGLRGKKRNITKEWRENISKGKVKGADKWAKGRSIKPSGYIAITRGKHKGRGEHVVIMEEIIGRKLYINECVHHKDFIRSNNEPDNLELMTKSEHLKLHRKLDNHKRVRDDKGRFI